MDRLCALVMAITGTMVVLILATDPRLTASISQDYKMAYITLVILGCWLWSLYYLFMRKDKPEAKDGSL